MSAFIWSFVWDFLYHLMPSFVQQILLNWQSKYNWTTCQACPYFVPVAGSFFRGFSELFPCQHAARLHYVRDFSQSKTNISAPAMVQAVFCGPHGFSAQGKESNTTLQECLLQRHILGGLVKDEDFTGNYQQPPAA